VLADPERPRVGRGWDPDPPEQNGNQQVVARPGPGSGPFHYVWWNGTEMELTGERNGAYRVRLTETLDAWNPGDKTVLLPAGTPPPVGRVSVVRMDPQPGWIDVRVALTRRLPYRVDEGDRSLSLHVYGATSQANFLQHGRVDPYIERAEWSQPQSRLFRLDIHLAGPPWGYEVFWGEGGDLVLRLRRPPAVDPTHPLRGLTVAVDPGHGGADRATMGPTGLTEADANLWIALQLQPLLERAGARVVMTRTTDATVSLVQRTDLARNTNADVFISVHNNAFPDGVNPWENNGTSVYYTHPRAARLAWLTQEELLAELGLRDLGVGRGDFHVTRQTWVPAILTETAFMMIPDQEAALRRPDVQRRIAEAHVRGLERWLREMSGTGGGSGAAAN
jgi:N-acetylmuramoyl-L-alanine amidase